METTVFIHESIPLIAKDFVLNPTEYKKGECIIIKNVEFNGFQYDIKLVRNLDDDHMDVEDESIEDYAWSEVVKYDNEGQEVGCTDVFEAQDLVDFFLNLQPLEVGFGDETIVFNPKLEDSYEVSV